MWRETRQHYLLFVMTIVAGATMTHSLVPPTPGPLFVAQAMGIDIALLMQQGLIVSACAAIGGYAYARYADRRWPLEVRSTSGAPEPASVLAEDITSPSASLPPLALSLLPILLPVILISADSALDTSTGCLYRPLSSWKRPPKEPMSDSTPGVNVDRARPRIRRTASLPASISTPEDL